MSELKFKFGDTVMANGKLGLVVGIDVAVECPACYCVVFDERSRIWMQPDDLAAVPPGVTFFPLAEALPPPPNPLRDALTAYGEVTYNMEVMQVRREELRQIIANTDREMKPQGGAK